MTVTQLGTPGHPLRVAIVGSGPAGFFVAQHLLGKQDLAVTVDMFERLPTPFGLVRFGVAPDHEEIKRVARQFAKTAARPGFRFFGNVDVGRHVRLEDLRRHYHQICFTTGAQTDRRLGIPGEDLAGSHAATEFVAWYNGHPDFRDRAFDLTAERVAVIGVGNVAVDVARVLARSAEELAGTDIADHALAALRASAVREVVMLGRRGPLQAAFTNAEVRELGEIAGADVVVRPEEIALDPASRAALAASEDRTLAKKVEILNDFACREPVGRPRRLVLRFLVSPLELLGDARGRVRAMRVVRNRLVADGRGGFTAQATGEMEEWPVGLVFRSVGYRGVPIAGLPFDERRGVVPNRAGRVLDPGGPGGAAAGAGGGTPLVGLYVAGWIKRGPTGVIGTNKPDAAETVEAMVRDAASGDTLDPAEPAGAAPDARVRQRQPAVVSYEDWLALERLEEERGAPAGRPRVKLTSVAEMLAALRALRAGQAARAPDDA